MSDRRLLRLVDIDAEILRLTHRQENLQAGIPLAEAKGRAEATETLAGELDLELDSLGSQERSLSAEDDTLHRKLEAEEKRMYDGSIVNQKELTALQHEIDNVKGRISGLEDQELALMERREQLEAALAAAKIERDAARATFEEQKAAATAELDQIAVSLETNTSDRVVASSGIDPELLELYEEMRASKHGVGAAALVDGTCQGCHESLSALDLDKIKHAEDVVRCPNCRRILVP